MKNARDRNHADQVYTEGRMAPIRPYTGDGKTTRDIYDRVECVERTADGKRRRS